MGAGILAAEWDDTAAELDAIAALMQNQAAGLHGRAVHARQMAGLIRKAAADGEL